MSTSTRYPAEVRERAVRMVFEHEDQYDSQRAAIGSISAKLGMTAETLRTWVRRPETDQGLRPGLSTTERERLKETRPPGTSWRPLVQTVRRTSPH